MDFAGNSSTTETCGVFGLLKEEITEWEGMMFGMNGPKAVYGILDMLNDP